MARLPRLSIPGYPHHLIQRGNNRQAIFLNDADRERMLALLLEHSVKNQVAIHAYVLMDNHFHLLVTPETATGLPAMMQAVGRSYVRYFNDRAGRTGTLWEGRYRSTVLETGRYLLACMAYMDLNPVRAGMVHAPSDFVWSSHAHHVGRRLDKLVTPHPLVWGLGNTPFAREAAYAELVRAGVGAADQKALTDATLRGWALGGEGFLAELQRQTPRRLQQGSPGRPVSTGKTRPQ
ncbi:transposase [Hydrogenophaga crassostreae]|uniref:Transposase n=1 Tax=Hydrogenophaga crassostreae TaxID=1763535 RepID=A0A162YYJ9_9BURK|nr:transposase [Hydrogenophaga crassostreae]AOW12259.1 transposase [Hydrogenophaga crassostreae]OAD41207.1 transposase [Hydrogenophaga crassostreae]